MGKWAKALTVVLLPMLCLAGQSLSSPVAAQRPPNIVFILTDDQAIDTLQKMPHVQRLARYGTTFRRAFVSTSLCCPSRATILTGLLAGHTGVWTNGDGNTRWGGWPAFRRNGIERNGSPFNGDGDNERRTIAVYLRRAGYRTGLFGKYLNHYEKPSGRVPPIPPGWSSWHSFIGGNGAYYGYRSSDQGKRHFHGSKPRDYSTDLFGRKARQFLLSPGIQHGSLPFFLFYAPHAPHGPVTPAPGFADVAAARPFETRAYNELRVNDKPGYVRNAPLIGPHQRDHLGVTWDDVYGTLRSVDAWVGRFRRALPLRVRHRTIFIFMSDNGFTWGDHRLDYKEYPYERSIRVPLIIAGPGIAHASTPALVTNTDLTPTILDLAGLGGTGGPFDGHSLKRVLTGTSGSGTKAILLEHLTTKRAPSFCGLRTNSWKYVLYRSGFQELYNLTRDPYELTNVAHQRPNVRRNLRRATLAACHPRPPDW